MKKIFICVLSICSLLLAACGNGDKGLLDGGSSDLTHHAESLVVTPKDTSIPVAFTQQMHAEAVLEDNQVLDVTTDTALTWQSSDSNIATIDSAGLVTGKAIGKVTITATAKNENGSVVKDAAVITINNSVATALQVTPKTSSVPTGLTQAFKAEAVLSNGDIIDVTNYAELTWSSSDTTIASISNDTANKGVATGLVEGVSTITANGTVGGVTLTDTAKLTVAATTVQRIEVSPHASSVAKGYYRQFTATAIFTDNTTKNITDNVEWTTDNDAIATISNDRNSKGLANGMLQGGVNVTANIEVNGSSYSDNAILTVTDAELESLVVTPATETTPVGLTKSFKAMAYFSDGSDLDITTSPTISWISSATNIATISNMANKGQATGVSAGEVTITATNTFLSASATLTVTEATVVDLQLTPTRETVPAGFTKPFKATAIFSDKTAIDVTDNPALSWSTSDTNIATIVTGQAAGNGIAKGESVGRVTIFAVGEADGHHFSADASLDVTNATVTALQVTPPTETSIVGLPKPFTATALMSDGSTIPVTNDPSIHWTSGDESIARVVSNQENGNGFAIGIKEGQTTIIASAPEQQLEASATFNVIAPSLEDFSVSPTSVTLPLGAHDNLMATALFEGDAELAVNRLSHWRSSNDAVVTVGEDGELTSYSTGTATITATFNYAGETYTDTANVTVTVAEVESIVITPQAAEIPKGLTQAFTAKAIYSDDSEVDITTAATTSWTSSDKDIATVSSSGSDKGVATGENEGEAIITVRNGYGITATASLTVSAAILTSIEVSPSPVSVGKEKNTSLVATGYYSDGTNQNITTTVNWTGQDTNIATVENGKVTGVEVGNTTTVASLGDISSEPVTIEVIPALTRIEVTPNDISVVAKGTEQLTVIGFYNNDSSKEITDSVSWNIADPTLAEISEGESGGVVSSGNKSDGLTPTTATAQLNDVVSNTITILGCKSLAETCIDIIDTTENNGTGKLYTSSPSVKYLDSIGGSDNSGIYDNDGGPLGSNPKGDFYLFSEKNAQALCETYNALALGGRTNWYLPEKDELFNDLYQQYGNMSKARGWPSYRTYISSTLEGSNVYHVSLMDGKIISFSINSITIYASCASMPE